MESFLAAKRMTSILTKAAHDFRRLTLRQFARKVVAKVTKNVRAGRARLVGSLRGLGIQDSKLERHLRRQGISRAEWSEVFTAELARRSLLLGPGSVGPPRFATAAQVIMNKGNQARSHVFSLLGSGPVRVGPGIEVAGRDGHRYAMPALKSAYADPQAVAANVPYEPIDWHVDFVSGFRWPHDAWHADIVPGRDPRADIKVPWELARCYHLVTLAQCFRLSVDRSYALEIVAQIKDFILANPVGYGVNWVTPMDVAIRVSNWLVALAAVADARALDRESAWLIGKSVFDHANFIEQNLEWSTEINGNHYTANLIGLFFVGTYCPHLPRASYWHKFARERLEQEIDSQVYADGCNFEGSTHYHRLVAELFFYAALLARRDGRALSKSYLKRLEAMFGVVRSLCFRNGEMPQIGDNDSARFIVVDALPVDSLRVDHYLPVADWFFGRPAAGYAKDVDLTPLWWLSGETREPGPSRAWESREGALFGNAGWAACREGDWECVVSCGPNGQGGNGGHGHNDKLAVSISFDGIPLVVDPGTYVYSADVAARNLYRSTSYHSTPQLVGQEQNALPRSLFSLPDRSRAHVVRLERSSVTATHNAFTSPVTATLDTTREGVSVHYSVGPGRYVMRWLLHPGVSAEHYSNGAVLRAGGHVFELQVSVGAPAVGDYRYSPAYGVAQQAQVLTLEFTSSLAWRLVRRQQ
jgi:hypothetical protein